MIDIMEYISVAGISAGALCMLLALLLSERPRRAAARWLGVVVAVVAIAVPVLHLGTTLGRATPWLPEGVYTIHGWKTVEDAGRIYLLVAQEFAEEARQFEVPFDAELALELQDFHRDAKKLEKLCLVVDAPGGREPQFHTYRILGRTYMADCPPGW